MTIIGGLVVLTVIVLLARPGTLKSLSEPHSWDEETVQGSGADKVVQLSVDGVIAEKPGLTETFNSGDFISQLDQAKKDEAVKAVVIRINSPGGEVVASDEILNKIREVKRAGKPVIVSMGGMAASGGYYIATAADRIYANPTTLTGSLGVIFTVPNYQKAADWLGYKEIVIKSGTYKDIGNPLRPMSDGEKEILQNLVNEAYQQFVNVISQGRNIPREQVLKIADGRVYSGMQAKQLKLIDDFGSLEDATNYAIQKAGLKDAQVVRYTPKFSLSGLLTGTSMQFKGSPAAWLQQIAPSFSPEPRLLYLFQP